MRCLDPGRIAAAMLPFVTLISTTALPGQTVTLDEGSYRLLIGGREVGRETFSIRQNGVGESAIIIAQGRVVLDTVGGATELNSRLQVSGSAQRPSAYQVSVRGADAQEIAGRMVGGRFSARITSAAGETMREYLASHGAVLLDEGITHHYYFLTRRTEAGSFRVPIIIPRQNRQIAAEVATRGTETIQIAGGPVQATRMTVEPASGAVRRVWADTEGRILRVEIPARNFVAERTTLPR